MRTKIFPSAMLLLVAMLILSYDVPKGWMVAGNKSADYEMGTDVGHGQNGKNAATIKSVKRNIDGFGTLMQNFAATKYQGKRLRLTGYIKANEVDGWAGLWLRVDGKRVDPVTGKNKRTVLSFDNMYNRPIKGTQDFTRCEIILDVPDTAVNIAYGALLDGTGQIWFDGLKFDVVGDNVSQTGAKQEDPLNIDFQN